MSTLQRLILGLMPRTWAAAAEAETRTWMLRCPCGGSQSLWDAGGIRWKGTGRSITRLPCPHCGKVTWQKLEREAQ